METTILVLNIVLFCSISLSGFIINNQYKKIKYFESIAIYYKWHSAVFDSPYHNGWYLIQVNHNNKKFMVSFHNINKNKWYQDKEEQIENKDVISWCHLPNYTIPYVV